MYWGGRLPCKRELKSADRSPLPKRVILVPTRLQISVTRRVCAQTALSLVVVQITLAVSNLKWSVGRSTDAAMGSGQESRCVRYQMRLPSKQARARVQG